MKQLNLIWSILVITLAAVIAFFVGGYYGIEIHWYMLVLLVCAGLFIHLMIYVIRAEDIPDIEE